MTLKTGEIKLKISALKSQKSITFLNIFKYKAVILNSKKIFPNITALVFYTGSNKGNLGEQKSIL